MCTRGIVNSKPICDYWQHKVHKQPTKYLLRSGEQLPTPYSLLSVWAGKSSHSSVTGEKLFYSGHRSPLVSKRAIEKAWFI